MNNIEIKLRMLEECRKVEINLDRLKATLNKCWTGKPQAKMAYTDVGLKKFTSVHDKLATEMNKCVQKTVLPEWMTKRKITLIQKDPLKEPPQTTT